MVFLPVTTRGGSREELWPLLLEAVTVNNVLPLTSSCNLRCVFCSHRQNPPGIRACYFPPLPLKTLLTLIPFLDHSRKIIIGESSTRLCEGEPLTHPHFLTIIKEIKRKFPDTSLQITTNGTLLKKHLLEELLRLREGKNSVRPQNGDNSLMHRTPPNLELVISLNSAAPARRARIMGDKEPQRVLQAMAFCREYGLPFHGSVVAWPEFEGREDLKRTLFFLEEMGALTTRVFLPGRTHFSPEEVSLDLSLWEEMVDFIRECAAFLRHPVMTEPPLKRDLLARAEGVIRGSPAQQAGLKRGDLITAVNGEKVLTAVHAFYAIQKAADPTVEILRPERVSPGPQKLPPGTFSVRLSKGRGEPSGLVFAFDLEKEAAEKVRTAIKRQKAQRPFLLTSRLAAPLWEAARRESLVPEKMQIRVVENKFFGGNIACAGLLTVFDFKRTLEEMIRKKEEPDLIMVPLQPFDGRGRDLRGEHYKTLPALFPRFSFSFL